MKIERKTCIRIGIVCVAVFLLIYYWDFAIGALGMVWKAVTPLLLGCVIAYVVNILMSFFERHYPFLSSGWQKARRPLCLIAALAVIILAAATIICLVLPELVKCVQLLLEQLPGAFTAAYEWLEEKYQISEALTQTNISLPSGEQEWKDLISRVLDVLLHGIGGVAETVVSLVSSAVSGIVTFAVALIFSIYILMSKERLCRQAKTLITTYLPSRTAESILYVTQTLDRSFHSFIVGQCVEAVILGVLCTLGMLLLRLPYAAMIGALIGCTALIPVAGAYIGGIVGAILIMTVSPMKALIFLVFLILLQQFEGNVIYPRVVGSSIGLPAIWVLTAVTVGGGVGGIGGILLAVPLTSTLYQLLKTDLQKRKENNHDPQNAQQVRNEDRLQLH